MNNQITGTILKILEAEIKTDKFSLQKVIIDTGDQYPQRIAVQFVNDMITMVDDLNIGDLVQFNININGNEWENPKKEMVYFTSINCWAFEMVMKSLPEDLTGAEDDDLPF